MENNVDAQKELLIRQREVFTENYWFVQGKLARRLIGPAAPEVRSKALKELSWLGVEFELPKYQIVLLKINDFRIIMKEISRLERDNIFREIRGIIFEAFSLKEILLCFPDENFNLVILRNFRENGRLYEATCIKEIQRKVKERTGRIVTVSCGEEKDIIEELPCSYNEANYAMCGSTGQEREPLLRYVPEKQEKYNRFEEKLYRVENSVIQCVCIGDREKIAREVDRFFDMTENTVFYLWQLKYACIRLIVLGVHNLEEMGIFCAGYNEEAEDLMGRLNLCETRESLRQVVKEIFDKIEGAVCEKSDNSHFLVRKALRYIEQNYSNEIKVKDLSELLKITPNYFSRIFKEQTGENFVDYLNKLRIKKAMVLLKQSGLKIYQISELVGYSDYKYFSQTFRKYMRCAPKDFRNLRIGEKIEV